MTQSCRTPLERMPLEELQKHEAVEALKGVLDEIDDYLEQRQDIRDGSDGPRPNTEMSLLSDLRWWRDSAGMCSATSESK